MAVTKEDIQAWMSQNWTGDNYETVAKKMLEHDVDMSQMINAYPGYDKEAKTLADVYDAVHFNTRGTLPKNPNHMVSSPNTNPPVTSPSITPSVSVPTPSPQPAVQTQNPTPLPRPQPLPMGGGYTAPRLNLGNLYRFGSFGQQQQQQPNFQQPMGNQNSLYNMLAGLFGFGGSGGRGGVPDRANRLPSGYDFGGGSTGYPSNNGRFNNDIGWPSNYPQVSTGIPDYSNVRPAGMGIKPGGPNVSAVGVIPQYAQGGGINYNNPYINHSSIPQYGGGSPNMLDGPYNTGQFGGTPNYQGSGMPSWMNPDIMNYMGRGKY